MRARLEQIRVFLEANYGVSILLRISIVVLITYLVSHTLKKLWNRAPKSSQLLYWKFIYNMIQAAVYLLGTLLAIGQIPQLSRVTQTILAGSGILALAVSLSAQESLNNIISGMFITLFKPFEVGDRITLVNNHITGTIEDITLRHTLIKTFTNTRIVIPNATINKEIIENSNLVDSNASAFVDVAVAYESDIDRAMIIMADVIGRHPQYLDTRTDEEKETVPRVKVYVRELGDSGIMLRANMWTRTVNENFAACSDVRLQIKKTFDEEGIEIPYTKYTIIQQKPATGKKNPPQTEEWDTKEES